MQSLRHPPSQNPGPQPTWRALLYGRVPPRSQDCAPSMPHSVWCLSLLLAAGEAFYLPGVSPKEYKTVTRSRSR